MKEGKLETIAKVGRAIWIAPLYMVRAVQAYLTDYEDTNILEEIKQLENYIRGN